MRSPRLAGWSVLLLCAIGGGAIGCGANVIFGSDGDEGGGGEGGDGSGGFPTNGPGPGPGPGTNSATTSNMQDSVVTSVVMSFCDDIGVCEGDGFTPLSGCLECSILGDQGDALDGGACSEAYFTCLGQDGGCGNGEPCCAFLDCADACQNLPEQEMFDCICANDGMSCLQDQPPGSCFGDHPEGVQRYIELDSCLNFEVCPSSCG